MNQNCSHTIDQRLAFISPGSNRVAGSGAAFYMAAQLRAICQEVIDIPSANIKPSLMRKAVWRTYRAVTGHAVRWKSTRGYARLAAVELRKQIAVSRPTALFNAMATWDVAGLDSSLPLINCSDSTLPLASGLGYPLFRELSARDFAVAMALEGGVARRAVLNLVATEWVARSLVDQFGVSNETIRVIPLGANLDCDEIPSKDEVVRISPGDKCHLLFVGVDWVRKGGDVAYETLLRVLEAGIPADLTIVGCEPPTSVAHASVRVAGRLRKPDAEDRRKLGELFMKSSFLFLPTRADTFGHVFCEAGAFGLPVVTTNVGGVGEVVRNGENGFALPVTAGPQEYAEVIKRLWNNHDEYRAISFGGREAYDRSLNWGSWGRSVREAINHLSRPG